MAPESTGARAAFGLRVRCRFDAPGVAVAAAASASSDRVLDIGIGSPGAAETGERLVHLRFQGGELSIRRGERDDALHFAHTYFGEYELDGEGVSLTCDPAPLPVWQWQRFLVGQLLPAASLMRGLGPMHCSAAVVGGRAVLIVGTSGAGKTTALLHLIREGARMLADDVAALDLTPDGVVAHPGSALCNVGLDALDLLPGGATVLGSAHGEARVQMDAVHAEPAVVGAVWVVLRSTEIEQLEIDHRPDNGSWPAALLGTHFGAALARPRDAERWLQTVAALIGQAELRVMRSPADGDPAAVGAAIMNG